jgi:uncharacterized membrane protein HdeD (DUF308 family)
MGAMNWARGQLGKAMPAGPAEPLKSRDVIKTYRYLRIGMIGAVVLLAASIVVEHMKAGCWQTSVSAYYYTPVRSIFVGSMISVGLALIVYKGRSALEDSFLNVAGMLAPVVAVAPTMDFGRCWSVKPNPLPINHDGSVAVWVVRSIDNNFHALLIAGGIGVVVAFIIAIVVNRGDRPQAERVDRWTMVSLAATALALVVGWLLIQQWGDFNTRAHGLAAVFMFVFLTAAIIVKAIEHRHERDKAWFWVYSAIAALMILGAVIISVPPRIFDDYTTFALEAYEIAFFAAYWIVQTAENWNEKVTGIAPAAPRADDS